jgi:hypothetical protein
MMHVHAEGTVREEAVSSPPMMGGSMVILTDPVAPVAVPLRTPVEPAAPLDPPDVHGRSMIFELESHGGYARTVVGGVAYLDREANTYFIGSPDGSLIRVPLRDIMACREIDRPASPGLT